MDTILNEMLKKYDITSIDDEKQALKEVLQEIALCGLSRAGFFKVSAFYGGTALRICYGLDRFSEDLDFSLLVPNLDFNLSDYFNILQDQINSVGLNFTIEEKDKTKDSAIKSAFLKGNTREHILTFYNDPKAQNSVSSNELLKIKFEVDTNPPDYANFENKYLLLPSPFKVKIYDLPSLFAGKIHAVICRSWKNRVKGRDLYDYVFYLSKGASVNLEHLKARLKQTNYPFDSETFDNESLINLLCEHFDTIDYTQAKSDVEPFIKDKSKLNLWSAEFFKDITQNLKIS